METGAVTFFPRLSTFFCVVFWPLFMHICSLLALPAAGALVLFVAKRPI